MDMEQKGLIPDDEKTYLPNALPCHGIPYRRNLTPRLSHKLSLTGLKRSRKNS